MEWIDDAVMGRDEEIFSNYKINFLLARTVVIVGDGGEVQDKVDDIWVDVYLGAKGGGEEFIADELVNTKLVHKTANFFARRGLHIYPNQIIVCISGNH